MLVDEQQPRVMEIFPSLTNASSDFMRQFWQAANLVRIDAGQLIASDGQACDQLSLVLTGSVRVYKLADSGREITLYRIKKGDSCVLTASCIMSNAHFPAMAVTETEVEALVLPAPQAKKWMALDEVWRGFVFELVARRLGEVISVVEDLAFYRMDRRIAAYLLAMSLHDERLSITHQQIAADLGTSREVVSRIIKEFASRGLLLTARGSIELRDRQALQQISGHV